MRTIERILRELIKSDNNLARDVRINHLLQIEYRRAYNQARYAKHPEKRDEGG